MSPQTSSERLVLFSLLSFSFAIIIFALTGMFSRYIADDYCFAANMASGFWSAQWISYASWSGRYTATFLLSIGDLLGMKNTVIWTPLMLILWGKILAKVSKQLLPDLPKDLSWLSAFVILFFVILMAPNRFQSFYWRVGIATYSIPLITLTSLVALFLFVIPRNEKSFNWVAIFFLLSFISGGFSETTGVLQTGFIGIMICAWLFLYRRTIGFVYLSSMLIGSLFALAAMALAPGTSVRLGLMVAHPTPITLILLSLRYAFDFIVDVVRSYPVPMLVLAMVSMVIGTRMKPFFLHNILTLLVSVIIICYLLIVCIMVPSVYAQYAYPEARALVVADYVLVVSVFSIFVLVGVLLSSHIAGSWLKSLPILVLLIGGVLYPVRASIEAFDQINIMRDRAVAWDARNEQILLAISQGITGIQVPVIDSFYLLEEITPDPSHWVNTCAARAYGVQSIWVP